MRAVTRTLLVCFWLSCCVPALIAGDSQSSTQNSPAEGSGPVAAEEAPTATVSGGNPSARLKVVFKQGKLAILANGCSLDEILRAVHQLTGATIEALPEVAGDRVVAQIGPGDPSLVLADLLDRSGVNFIIQGGRIKAIRRVIVMPVPVQAPPAGTDAVAVEPAAEVTEASAAPAVKAEPEKSPAETKNENAGEEKAAASASVADEKAAAIAAPDSASATNPDTNVASAGDGTKTQTDGTATTPADSPANPVAGNPAATPAEAAANGPPNDAATAPTDTVAAASTSDAPGADGSQSVATSPDDAAAQSADQNSPPPQVATLPDAIVSGFPSGSSASSSGGGFVGGNGSGSSPLVPDVTLPPVEQPAQNTVPAKETQPASGSNLSIPGIPQEILNQICQLYGGSCAQVQQEINNAPPPPQQVTCQRVVNVQTGSGHCAN
jgi:hypothetical protein